MSEQQNGDWYCRQCGYLSSSRVTYSETCDTCHQPVEFHTVAEMSEIESLRQQLAQSQQESQDKSGELIAWIHTNDELRAQLVEAKRQLAEARAGRVPDSMVALAPSRVGRVYIAGPMTGIEDYNFPAFNAAADALRTAGYHVENPADHGIVDGAEWSDYLRYDIARLATCETLALLPDWSQSKGARLERQIADALGMPVIYLNDAEQQPPAGGVGPDDLPSLLRRAFPLFPNSGEIDEVEHCCEWTLQKDRERLHSILAAQPQQEVGN